MNNNNVGQKLTNHARSAFLKAESIARKFHHKTITNDHLLLAIFEEKGSVGRNVLLDTGLTKQHFQRVAAEPVSAAHHPAFKAIPPAAELKKVFFRSYALAKEFDYPYVGTEHLLYALTNAHDTSLSAVLTETEAENIRTSIKALLDPSQFSHFSKMFNLPEITVGKKGRTKISATPFVDKFCVNVSEEARIKQEVTIGREKEIGRIINILGRKNKNNPLLIGDPGVGKTALISGLARLIMAGDVPPSLYKKRIMNLDVTQLIAGTSFRGEFESRLKEIIKEVSQHKDIILFIDEIHNIVGAGNVAGGLDLANIIKPALARGEMQLIGATTHEEFKKHIEKDAALERRFQPIVVREPDRSEAEEILFGIRPNYETFHNVSISDESIILAVDLSLRYIQNRFLPDKAIDVIDETASNIRSRQKVSDFFREISALEDQKQALVELKEKLVSQENFEKAIELRSQEKNLEQKIKLLRQQQAQSEAEHPIAIQAADIIETVARISGIPAEKLAQAKTKKIKNVKNILSKNIIGQKEATDKIASALLRSQSGITNPDRPLGSFLFLGPTGVGKTLTAKILAQEFFSDPKSLIRVDMSELMERHSVSSLIGSPAGYVGYGEGGNLTEKVRRNPYAVVLFDEIEKAHPDVFNILLQILEDGILTDAAGTRVSFKNTVIILTSNIGTDDFTRASQVGFEGTDSSRNALNEKFEAIKEQSIKELEQRLRPELLNRLDNILVFNALSQADIRQIAVLELKKLKKRLEKQKLQLALGTKVPETIARKSLAINQGARLVRKNIQEMIENPIAEMIVYDKVKNAKISVKVEKGEIKIA